MCSTFHTNMYLSNRKMSLCFYIYMIFKDYVKCLLDNDHLIIFFSVVKNCLVDKLSLHSFLFVHFSFACENKYMIMKLYYCH